MDLYTQLELKHAALIIIDTQCDTLDGQPFEIAGTSAVLPNMVELLNTFRIKRLPIVHIVRIYKADGSNADLCRRSALENGAKLLVEGTPGCEPAPALLPGSSITLDHERLLSGRFQEIGPTEWIIYKPRWGAFYHTPLEDHLRSLGVNSLVFSGCNFPNCPRTSIYEASERDFKIALAADAVSGLYDQGKIELEKIGVHVLTSKALLKELDGL